MPRTTIQAREQEWSGRANFCEAVTGSRRERMRLVALAVLIASAAGFLYLIVTAHGLVDFQGRPLGTDFSNVYAAGTYVLRRRPAGAVRPRRASTRASKQSSAKRRRSTAGTIRRSFCSSPRRWRLMPYGVGARGLAGGHVRPLSSDDPRDHRLVIPGRAKREPESIATTLPRSAPGRVDDSSHGTGGAAADPLWLLLAVAFPAVLVNLGHGQNGFLTAALLRRRAGHARSPADRRRHPVRASGLQAAIRADDPARARRERALALLSPPRRRRSRCSRSRPPLAFGPQIWHAFFELDPLHPHSSRSSRATPAGTRFRACSPGRACGAHRSRSPTLLQGALAAALAAALVAAVAQRRALSAQGGGALPRCDPRDALHLRLRHDGARAGHRLPRRRRIRARVPTVGEDDAGRALAGAARGAQCRTSRHLFLSALRRCSQCLFSCCGAPRVDFISPLAFSDVHH